MKREVRAKRPARVVRARQRQESAGRLARTGCVDAFDVEPLRDDLGIADEVGSIRPESRNWAKAERHRVAEREIADPFARSRSRDRGDHQEGSCREPREKSTLHIQDLPTLTAGLPARASNLITDRAGAPLRTRASLPSISKDPHRAHSRH